MKKLVAVVLVLAMMCGVALCYAEDIDVEKETMELLRCLEFRNETGDIQSTIYESKLKFIRDKYDAGEELNNSEVLLAIYYTREIIQLETIQLIEMGAWLSGGKTTEELSDIQGNVSEAMQYLDTFEDLFLSGSFDKESVMQIVASTFDTVKGFADN